MEDLWQDLKEKIEKLDKYNQIEILKIFLKHNVEITENNNGSFINLTYVKKRAFNEIQKYLKYIEKQEETLRETENLKNEMKLLIK